MKHMRGWFRHFSIVMRKKVLLGQAMMNFTVDDWVEHTAQVVDPISSLDCALVILHVIGLGIWGCHI